MSTVIEAEYIAGENILKLSAPLEGIENHARLELEIKKPAPRPEQPWMRLEGSLSAEEGRALAKAVRDAYGRDEIEV